jgi:hypothetical protein
MLVGVDTFDTHLDMIQWDGFRTWNGGSLGLDGKLSGGEPAFAGRNFVGGDYLWGHSEATDAMKAPRPENLSAISVTVPLIAAMQAPQPDRQQVSGYHGFLNGQIDAHALCSKVFWSIMAGEFRAPSLIDVWLAVDPAVTLAAEYWVGWADTVNSFSPQNVDAVVVGPTAVAAQPFRACILCRYTKDGGKFSRDPHVTQALSAALDFRGHQTTCYSFWADAPDADTGGVRPNPSLDWTMFDAAQMPAVWRFSTSYRDADGNPADENFSLDVVREFDPPGTPENATAFMLRPQSWQPNVPGILNYGFVVYLDLGITAQQIADMQAHPFPAMTDNSGNFHLPQGGVVAAGRYLKTPGHPNLNSMSRNEAELISNGGFKIFTVWESHNDLAGGEPTMNDPPPAVQKAFKIGIAYFDPVVHAGTEDGRFAFSYCGDVLRQPPHTPVFFCVDFDAADPHDTSPVSKADSQARIENYLKLIKEERDSYARLNPGRYYLIGLYANGAVNRWAYEQGVVSMFWQSLSTGSSGNTPPNRPWYHANRWQFNDQDGLNPLWPFVQGADPDADWGDGGTWSLLEPLAQDLSQLEDLEKTGQLLQTFLPLWGGLLL